MVKIKICGLRREQDIAYVNELKPDYIGFILTDGFRRSIDIETARHLRAGLDKDIRVVGVFVNDDIEKINMLLEEKIIDIVQLHGNESADFCGKINAPVIKYFKPDMFGKIKEYDTDFYLFDSGSGTGRTFDWSTLPKVDRPFFLAGGIGKDNISAAIRDIKPYCIDLSSSVETKGFKDYIKIKQIMDIVRDGEVKYE